MNKKRVMDLLGTISKAVKEIYDELDVSGEVVTKAVKPLRDNTKSKREKGVDLSGPIKSLYDAGFFKEGKIDLDVAKELQLRLLTSKKPIRTSIVNVLRRMVTKGLLTRNPIIKDKQTILLYKNVTS